MSNYTCTGTVSEAATPTTTSVSGYQCAGGWITPNPAEAYCIRFTGDPTQISCLHNNSVNDALWLYYGQHYVCELYYPNSMAPRSPTNPPYVTTYTTTYSCPNGYQLSGQNCTYSGTTPAIPSTSYSCPGGYTLSGYTCTSTSTTGSTAGSSGYTCPSGYTLSGSTCSETSTYQASNGSICNAGDSLSGTTCTHTVTQAATNSPTCNSGDTLSGTTCINSYTYGYGGSPYVSSYTCNAGDSLSGSTCTNQYTSNYTGTEDIYYTCPNGNWILDNPNAYNAHGCYNIFTATSQASCVNNGDVWLGGGSNNCERYTSNVENISWICNGGDAGGGSSSTCYHANVTTYAATPSYSYSCNGGDSGGGASSTCYHTTTTYYAATNNYSCPSGYTLSASTCSESTTYQATYTSTTIYYYGFSG
jgi:conjugal transfer mating pair stabilization protein TraN